MANYDEAFAMFPDKGTQIDTSRTEILLFSIRQKEPTIDGTSLVGLLACKF